MRWLLAVALLAAAAAAADREEIEALVERLGAPDRIDRERAYLELCSLGDEILPVLAELDPADPEIRRYLRALLRRTRRLRLQVVRPPDELALGAPLFLEVELRNETEDTYSVPLVRRPPQGAGTWSVFCVTVNGERHRLSPDDVEVLTQIDRWNILEPGQSLRASLTLEGEKNPVRRPGPFDIVVSFETDNLVKYYGHSQRPEEMHSETSPKLLEAKSVRIVAVGRAPAALEAALAGEEKERAGAVAELSLRNDAEVLPLLRKHAGEPDLRLAAVTRLGEAAREEDLELMLAAAKEDPQKDVRLAAVAALAKYPQDSARRRLCRLIDDHELQLAAIRALRGHKHRFTVQRFIEKLKRAYREPAAVEEIRKILYEWTGMHVANNTHEIEAFERWWRDHGRFKDDK